MSLKRGPGPVSAGTTGEAALWGGSIVVMGMAANPLGAHQADELSLAKSAEIGVLASSPTAATAGTSDSDQIDGPWLDGATLCARNSLCNQRAICFEGLSESQSVTMPDEKGTATLRNWHARRHSPQSPMAEDLSVVPVSPILQTVHELWRTKSQIVSVPCETARSSFND